MAFGMEREHFATSLRSPELMPEGDPPVLQSYCPLDPKAIRAERISVCSADHYGRNTPETRPRCGCVHLATSSIHLSGENHSHAKVLCPQHNALWLHLIIVDIKYLRESKSLCPVLIELRAKVAIRFIVLYLVTKTLR